MNKISFIFKNKIQTIDFSDGIYSPTNTLLEYIRSLQNVKGTKEGCNEGDCGACTVVIVEKNGDNYKYRAVNSCVMFLPSVHGKQILTIEDIGSSEKLHPIQKIFVDKHSSQCGFCTPGFIMSLFAQKTDKSNSSKDELVEAMTGNLCRCTGYRPIVEAAEEISEIQDLKDAENYANINLINSIAVDKTIEIKTATNQYFIPFSVDEAIRLKTTYKDAILTSGSTDLVLRVTKRKEHLPKIIDISNITEIQNITETENEIIFGAGCKLEDIYQFSKTKLPAMAEMMSLFGAKQIRNRATIGGNVGTASPIGDVLPVLFALDADIIIKGETERKVNINDYIIGYRKTVLQENEVITAVLIKKPAKNQKTKSYKISKRTNLDISTVSTGFSVKFDNDIVSNIVLAFGGMAEKTKRATETEKFLTNKKWNEQNIREAMDILEKEFTPLSDARSSKEARVIMTKNLLLKFYEETK